MPTAQDFEREEEFLKGLPYFNWGALLMPPIWGPGHGEFAVILFYPLWLFVDNLIYAATQEPTVLSVGLAGIALTVVVLATLAYGRISQPRAAHRADRMGKTRQQYVATERKWTVACAVLAVLVVGLATYYNLLIRPTVGW
ncbi:MAG: viscotoxin-A3 [Coriobacteriia bacterium]|nr:viscotoxin-A3 [Coriobacteriia bacterium]